MYKFAIPDLFAGPPCVFASFPVLILIGAGWLEKGKRRHGGVGLIPMQGLVIEGQTPNLCCHPFLTLVQQQQHQIKLTTTN